jgi:hypothetical protein
MFKKMASIITNRRNKTIWTNVFKNAMDSTKMSNAQDNIKTVLILEDITLKILANKHALLSQVLMIRILADLFANTELTTHSLKLKINITISKKIVSIHANTQSMKTRAAQTPMSTVMISEDTTQKIHAIKHV